MKKAILASVVLHAAFMLTLGFGVCPWLERQSKALFGAVDVDVTVVANRAGTGQNVERLREHYKAAEPAPIPDTENQKLLAQSVQPAVSVGSATMSDEVTVAGGDGNPVALTTAGYARWVREHNKQPEYPRGAKIRGEQGRVVVRATVTQAGTLAQNVELEKSSNSQLLDQVALETVRSWHFLPFRGARLQITFQVPFEFSLY